MAESRGSFNIRSSDTSVLIRARLTSSAGTIITTGTASMYLLEFTPSTGAFKTLDWNDSTFKTTALTTAAVALTHQTFANSAINSGIWTYRITGSDLAALTVGNKYVAYITHTSLVESIAIEFQYGSVEGDDATVAALGTQAKADVNAEIVDALTVDQIAELVAIPGATPTIIQALMLTYMKIRNKETSTSTTATIANNAGTTISSSLLDDDGTTFTKDGYT